MVKISPGKHGHALAHFPILSEMMKCPSETRDVNLLTLLEPKSRRTTMSPNPKKKDPYNAETYGARAPLDAPRATPPGKYNRPYLYRRHHAKGYLLNKCTHGLGAQRGTTLPSQEPHTAADSFSAAFERIQFSAVQKNSDLPAKSQQKNENNQARDPDLIQHRPHLVKRRSDLLKHRADVQGYSGCSAQERDFLQDFQDAPHRSTILNEITRKF